MLHFQPHTVKHCPYHGKKCPNIQKADNLGLGKPPLMHRSPIKQVIETANSTCILASAAARNTISRRLGIINGSSASPWNIRGDLYQNNGMTPPNDPMSAKSAPPNDRLAREEIPKLLNQMERINDSFEKFITDNLWYIIKNAHVRVKISILETFAEKPATAGAAVAANTFIRTLRLARMVTDPKSLTINTPDVRKLAQKEGVHPSYLVATDTARVLINRLRSVLYLHPELWMIVYSILKHDLQDKKHILNTADKIKFYRAWGVKGKFSHSELSIVSYATLFLNPSPANLKYQYLYTQHHHRHKQYGRGKRFLSVDKEFLLNHKCCTVMDFGCGKTRERDTSFTWVYYDPCIADRKQPYEGKVDGLVCYDVLEHVPINDLQVFVRWVKMYKPRCIVLGICTRPAASILANGENAHCTVRNNAWWVDWATKNFGDTMTVKQIKCTEKQYLNLHINANGQ